jgi:hypothetical protein
LAKLSNPKRVILAGIVVAALGTFSNLLGIQALKLVHSVDAFQVYADVTLIVQLVGLFVVLVGGIMFACSAPMNRVAWWGLSVAIIAVAVVQILDVSLMHKTAILVPVFYGAELTATSMLLISGLRFATKRWSAD